MGRKSSLPPEYEALRQKLIPIAMSNGYVKGSSWSYKCRDWFDYRFRNGITIEEIETQFMNTVFAGGDVRPSSGAKNRHEYSPAIKELIKVAMDNGYVSDSGKTWHANARTFVRVRLDKGLDEDLIVEQFMNSHYAGNKKCRQIVNKRGKTFRNQILDMIESNGYKENMSFNEFWNTIKHLSEGEILEAVKNSRFGKPNTASGNQRNTEFTSKYRKLFDIAIENGFVSPSQPSQPSSGVRWFIIQKEESGMSSDEIESEFMQSKYVHPRNVDELYTEIRLELTPIIRDQNGWIQESVSEGSISIPALMMIRRKLEAGWDKDEIIDYILKKSRYGKKNPALMMKEYLADMKGTANKIKSVFVKYNLSYTMFDIKSYDKPGDYDQVKVIKKVVSLITKEFDSTLAKIWADMITQKLEAA